MKPIVLGMIVLSALLTGCVSTYQHTELVAPASKLDAKQGVVISIPGNGFYQGTEYHNSGRMTANAVRAAFARNALRVEVTEACEGSGCLDELDASQFQYYVQPIILHWEDRATEWSGISDRLEIQIIVYDLTTKEQVVNSTYTGKSKFFTFGGDHPQDLLPQPTQAFVDALYQ